ncbi:hypothetical protein JOM56_012512 [Amanita muscaria]
MTASESPTLPRWVPFAMFAGTTVVLTIPLLIIRRQRPSSPSQATTAFAAVNFARPNLLGTKPTIKPPLDINPTPQSSSSEFSSPGPRELVSAISRVDHSTALLAGKAFGIATLIVTCSAFVVTWSAKTVMGIEDTRDFAHRTRKAVQAYLPSLVSSIHRPQVDDEHDVAVRALASVGAEQWNAEHSEKRLKLAYEKGGLDLWSRAASVEMEQELRFEREKRERGKRR